MSFPLNGKGPRPDSVQRTMEFSFLGFEEKNSDLEGKEGDQAATGGCISSVARLVPSNVVVWTHLF
jgi:hypothetical protein